MKIIKNIFGIRDEHITYPIDTEDRFIYDFTCCLLSRIENIMDFEGI